MFCEESLGKIKFRAFTKGVKLEAREKRPGDEVGNVSVYEFYLLKALTTLEQVNTTKYSKKIRILISKMVL